jgi:hypothetical protein
MRWTRIGWRYTSWCGRFTIEPSKVIPRRWDLKDAQSREGHVCRTPEAAQAVAANLSRRGRP